MDRDRMNRQGQAAAARRPRHLVLAIFAVLALALSAVLLATGADTGLKTGSASAATKKQLITGKLSKPGYTVIALARNGRARVKRAPKGSVQAAPAGRSGHASPAGLRRHLRRPDRRRRYMEPGQGGQEEAPAGREEAEEGQSQGSKASGKKAIRKAKRKVSAARKKVKQARRGVKQARRRASGKEVVLGVKPGAELGAISVKAAAGYSKAKLKLRQWKRWVVEENRARAKKGVPIGAGNFGRVRSKNTGGGAPGDLDLDGVADPLDIDDDGDMVLDNLDRKPRKGSKSRASAHASGDRVGRRLRPRDQPGRGRLPGGQPRTPTRA